MNRDRSVHAAICHYLLILNIRRNIGQHSHTNQETFLKGSQNLTAILRDQEIILPLDVSEFAVPKRDFQRTAHSLDPGGLI